MTERISVPFWTDPITGIRPPEPNNGMTLRDYFAAKAMQGILYEGLEPAETAKHAYAMADAMLKAREA